MHVKGEAIPFEREEQLKNHLHELVERFEKDNEPCWSFSDVSEKFLSVLSSQIFGFSISVTHIEAKFKLGQNRSPRDIQGVLTALGDSSSFSDREFAAFAQTGCLAAYRGRDQA